VGLEVVIEGQELLVVTEYGYGKRTPLEEYRVQGRGNQGVTTAKITQKNGHVVGIKVVEPDDELLLISSDGSIIRINVKEISQQGRSTQGVRLMELDPKDRIIDIAKIHV
jgi:DNA gyrase subunit A